MSIIELIFLCLLIFICLISYFKFDTFISFIIICLILGFGSGMNIKLISKTIQSGIGNTLGDLILIIGFGAMLGKIIEVGGAAHVITDRLINTFKAKNIVWGLAIAGLIIGIPIFYTAGFVLVMPIINQIAIKTKLPKLYLAIPILASLSVAHGFLPPHPSPVAICTILKVDLGKTLLYGIIVALPCIFFAGPLFSQLFINSKNANAIIIEIKNGISLKPPFYLSLIISLMPVILMGSATLLLLISPKNAFLEFFSEPFIGMLISLFLALFFLGIRQNISAMALKKHLETAFKDIAPILLILAGSGAFKQLLVETGASQSIGNTIMQFHFNIIILAWLIAACIRICLGSATIAGISSASIILPLMQNHVGISKELVVLAIGAGSLFGSHLNDSGFWLFKEYLNLSIKQTLKTWTMMESIISIVGLLSILLLNSIIIH